jgi:hypothetical protein
MIGETTRGVRWTILTAGILITLAPASLYAKKKDRAAPGSGLNRATFWELLSLYGRGDSHSVAEANRILDSVLPRTPSAPVDPDDKFTHAAAADFYRLYSARLPAALRERARWDLTTRVKTIERTWYPQHKTGFGMGHTNFAMMFLEAFVLGSEALGDSEARTKAYAAFNDFCDYTLHNGLTEFNATDYLRFDLHCMSSLATASVSPQVRRRARAFADFWWLDAALHYWPSGERLTGANARTYNYVAGIGGAVSLIRSFFGNGERATEGEGGWVARFDYQPPAYICEIAREKQRTIYQGLWLALEVDAFRKGFEGDDDFQRTAHGEFGHQYGKDRYTYIEPAYALGTGGAHYSTQERMLVADIAGRKELASISSQINTSLPLAAKDEFLSFLGDNRHAQTGSAAVEDRNLAMILYSLTLEAGKGVPIVAPLLLLPANVDGVFVNEQQADRHPGPHSISGKDILYLTEGGVYASLRFVEAAEGFAGYKPTYHYRLDGQYRLKAKGGEKARSFEVGASCVLYNGRQRMLSEKNVRAGFVVEMGTRQEFATLADFRRHIETTTSVFQRYANGIWEVRYRSGSREISLKKDLPRDLVLDKRVDGVRVEPPVHATNFSALKDGILTVTWEGEEHVIDLRRGGD